MLHQHIFKVVSDFCTKNGHNMELQRYPSFVRIQKIGAAEFNKMRVELGYFLFLGRSYKVRLYTETIFLRPSAVVLRVFCEYAPIFKVPKQRKV